MPDPTPSDDTTAPSIGAAATFSDITATSMTVSWGAATDGVTAAADLQYKVVYLDTNSVTTVADAEQYGTVALDWTADAQSASIPGIAVTALTRSTRYFVAVLVKDATGNKSIYTGDEITLCSGKRLYQVAVSNGNLGGVAGADALCTTGKPAGFGTVKAILGDLTNRRACGSGTTGATCTGSSSGRLDWIFTAGEDICSADSTIFIGTTDFNALLSSPVANIATGGLTGFNIYWGSNDSNCSNWTSTSGTAIAGTPIAEYTAPSCNAAATIYCVEQ